MRPLKGCRGPIKNNILTRPPNYVVGQTRVDPTKTKWFKKAKSIQINAKLLIKISD